jgi:hypothetical protein
MLRKQMLLLCLLVQQYLLVINAFLIPLQPSSTSRTTRTRQYNARDEAEALLAKARQARQQVADLQGISLQQVELEAQQRKESQRQANQASLDRRKQIRDASETVNRQQNSGSFLQVPETFDDQVYQAKQAVERAFQNNVTRQVVRFVLLEQDQTLLQQDGQWPGGAQQMYRVAAGPLTRALLSILKPLQQMNHGDESTTTTSATDNAAWTRKKPQVVAQDIWDFDGSALVTATWNDGGDSSLQSKFDSSTTTYAMVQPNTDDKYTRDIESLSQSVVGPNQLLLLVNPFWRNIESWGINLLAPNAKKNAQRVIFDECNFQETYCLIQKSVRGEVCVALKCYPYDWQLYAYADGEYWPFEPYLLHLGSTENEPTGNDFGNLLNGRNEFKLSKNMRQMNRMK